MAAAESLLQQKYDLVKLNVASGTQLTTRAADIAKSLSKNPPEGQPTVVSLSTRSRNANKLISIVEVAKRELGGKGIKVFQYNALSSETIQIERKQKPEPTATGADDEAADDFDDAFETMGEQGADGPKKRVIPVMTTYLSVSPVPELKTRYGYASDYVYRTNAHPLRI